MDLLEIQLNSHVYTLDNFEGHSVPRLSLLWKTLWKHLEWAGAGAGRGGYHRVDVNFSQTVKSILQDFKGCSMVNLSLKWETLWEHLKGGGRWGGLQWSRCTCVANIKQALQEGRGKMCVDTYGKRIAVTFKFSILSFRCSLEFQLPLDVRDSLDFPCAIDL